MKNNDPALGRFIQPDTIVPGATNPQAWNRYSYVVNNPIRMVDPTGHVSMPINWWDNESQYISKYSSTTREEAEEIFLDNMVDPVDMESNHISIYGLFANVATNTDACRAHPAVDFGPNSGGFGSDIYAVYDGIIAAKTVSQEKGFGTFIIIEHQIYGHSFFSLYAHLNTITQSLEVGDHVSASDIIGTMGNSGTGEVHLHFEVRTESGIDRTNRGANDGQVSVPYGRDYFWAYTADALFARWVDLGSRYGYGSLSSGRRPSSGEAWCERTSDGGFRSLISK